MKIDSLKNLARFIGSGCTPSRKNISYWNSSDVLWLKTEQLGEYKITSTAEQISHKAVTECNLRIYPKNTISVAMYGEGKTRGNVSLLDTPMTTNQACCNIEIDDAKIDYQYVYYYLKGQYENLRQLSAGVRKNLNADDIKNFLIRYPENKATQKKIAALLSALDDKIALNEKINATLEAMAKTFYDYWFVQFDFPDEHGRPYKSSGGKMIYSSELGRDIPEGWQIKTLKDICKIVDCLHSQKPIRMYEQERCFLLQLENLISLGIIDLGYKYYVSESDYNTWTAKIEVCEGDLIITNAGRVGAFARVPKGIKAGIGRNITAIRPERVSSVYLYYYLHSVDNLRQIRKNIDVGAFFNSLNVKGLKQISVLIPPKNLMEFFTRNCEPYRHKLELAACESQQIVALRDWLLPLLMNEQVKFKEDKNE